MVLSLIVRWLLGQQLDMVTDERVYISAGRLYLPLLEKLQLNDPHWNYNYEHPALVKLLIGMALQINQRLSSPLSLLIAARLPSILMGTILVGGIYWLARAPFGRTVALITALIVALSPWMAFFSSLAYLDTTMTALITLAYLTLWRALSRPKYYLLAAALLGLAGASKYTAILILPAMLLFPTYYYLFYQRILPKQQRQLLPWRWWLGALLLLALLFFLVNPQIWSHPRLLLSSIRFQLVHSENGHNTFLADRSFEHIPYWGAPYILMVKISLMITLPALFFCVTAFKALIQSIKKPRTDPAFLAQVFLLIWVASMVADLCLLRIVVGSHYLLPGLPPIALAGASGGYSVFQMIQQRWHSLNRYACTLVLLILMISPQLWGLVTTYGADGYTSEIFSGEDNTIQVAYSGYREGGEWLRQHSRLSKASVGMIAVVGTITPSFDGNSWKKYNLDLAPGWRFQEMHSTDPHFTFSTDYIIWPMHMVQRGNSIPESWRSHIVHTIQGGNTTYCYILARNPATMR